MLKTGADLTVSAGLTDEWGNRQVFADPSDSLQLALLTANHSVLNDLLTAQELGLGDLIALAPTEFIASSVYDYRSIERLWQFNGLADEKVGGRCRWGSLPRSIGAYLDGIEEPARGDGSDSVQRADR